MKAHAQRFKLTLALGTLEQILPVPFHGPHDHSGPCTSSSVHRIADVRLMLDLNNALGLVHPRPRLQFVDARAGKRALNDGIQSAYGQSQLFSKKLIMY